MTVFRLHREPSRASAVLNGLMEALVLLLVVLSPWALTSVPVYVPTVLLLGAAALLSLWALRMVLEGA